MKLKKALSLLITLAFIFLFNMKIFAVNEPELEITSNRYFVGELMSLDEESSVFVYEELKLYSLFATRNEDNPDEFTVNEINLSNVEWTSSDQNVAIVEDGVVEGISVGTAVITAKYTKNGQVMEATREITVEASKFSFTNYIVDITARGTSDFAKVGNSKTIYYSNSIVDNNSPSYQIYIDNEHIDKINNFDATKLKVVSSDKNIATVSVESNGNITINPLHEGVVTLTFEYDNNGEKLKGVKKIYVFNSENYDDSVINRKYVIYDKSFINIEKSKKSYLSLNLMKTGGSASEVPNQYFHYEWSSSDDGVVKIEESPISSEVIIVGVEAGIAEITCTITNTNENLPEKTLIKKATIVVEDKEKDVEVPEKTEETPTGVNVDDTSKKNNLLIISIATILSGMFIMYYKRKKSLN